MRIAQIVYSNCAFHLPGKRGQMAPTGSRNGRRALLLELQGRRLDMQLVNLKHKKSRDKDVALIRAEFKNEMRQVKKKINSQLRQIN